LPRWNPDTLVLEETFTIELVLEETFTIEMVEIFLTERPSNRNLKFTTADQIISSLSNLVFILLIAQSTNSNSFARISTLWTVISFSVVISRSVFGIPLLLDVKLSSADLNKTTRGSKIGVLLVGIPATITAITFMLLGQNSEILIYVGLAVGISLILLQDLGRYEAIASGTSSRALVSDLVLLTPLAVALAATWFMGVVISTLSAVLILMFSLIIAILALRQTGIFKLSLNGLTSILINDRHRRNKLFLESGFGALTAVSSIFAIWLAYGLDGATAFNGALLVLSPVSLTVLVINLVLQQSVSSTGGLIHRREYSIFFALLLSSILWTIFVGVIPDRYGHLLLGESWTLASSVLITMGAILCLSLVIEFTLITFRARSQFSIVVRIRLLIAILCPVTYLISGWLGFSLFVALLILAIFMLGIVGFLYARSKSYFQS